MSLSRKDIEELKPIVDKTVQNILGFSEPTLVMTAVNCVDKGYDQRKTVDKLSLYLDEEQASKFAAKLFDAYAEFKTLGKHGRSRKRREESVPEEAGDAKKTRLLEEPTPMVMLPVVMPTVPVPIPMVPDPGNPSPGQLTTDKIKEMMANAQRMIRERKAQLGVPETPGMCCRIIVPYILLKNPPDHILIINFKLSFGPLGFGINLQCSAKMSPFHFLNISCIFCIEKKYIHPKRYLSRFCLDYYKKCYIGWIYVNIEWQSHSVINIKV